VRNAVLLKRKSTSKGFKEKETAKLKEVSLVRMFNVKRRDNMWNLGKKNESCKKIRGSRLVINRSPRLGYWEFNPR